MASSLYLPLNAASVIIQDAELELIDRLAAGVLEVGTRVDRINVANLYVALKHRPIAIVAGPVGTGKAALVNCLANLLAGGNGLQIQLLSGHAWYAGVSPCSTVLIGMHNRLITEKLLAVIDEALQPENAQRIFVVGLLRISPAELLSFFTEVAYQVRHDEIMRIGDAHLSAPLPFPPNLLLIGTLDTEDFVWWDEDLLSGATVIEWPANVSVQQPVATCESPNLSREFIHSSIRSHQKACEKLFSVVEGTKQPLRAIMLIQGVIQEYGLEFSPALLDEVILYLANAWSQQGSGLFDDSKSRNLAIASDLAVTQLVLPHYLEEIRSSGSLHGDLCSILDAHLPRSSAFLGSHSEAHAHQITERK